MSSLSTPISVAVKKRDLTSPVFDLEQPSKKSKAALSSCSSFESVPEADTMSEHEQSVDKESGAGAGVVNMSLQHSDLAKLSLMLKDLFREEFKSMAKDLIEGITGAMQGEVRALQATVDSLKDDVRLLKDENAKLKQLHETSTADLDQRNDDLEQYTRRNSVRIAGLPELPGESTDELVLQLSKDLKAGIAAADIDRSSSRRDGTFLGYGSP